ncbi:MAG: hypothetical protein ACRDZO_07800 [Egibacteraceae bacterium]
MASPVLPTTLGHTRHALHRVAEHVVSPARYAVTGRIGLRPAPGGFSTPPFGEDERIVAVDGIDLVVISSGAERRAPLTTLRAAGEFAGVTPGAPAHLYTPATPLELDEPLNLDAEAAAALAGWLQLGEQALALFAAGIAEDEPSEAQLWPEHFDLGIAAAQVNYGVSPGDEHVADPYLYVGPDASTASRLSSPAPAGGPHGGPPPGEEGFWNAPFGATRAIHEIRSVDDAVTFFQAGRDRTLEIRRK